LKSNFYNTHLFKERQQQQEKQQKNCSTTAVIKFRRYCIDSELLGQPTNSDDAEKKKLQPEPETAAPN